MRKKLFASIICMTMILSVSAVVFANETEYVPKTPWITDQFELVPDAGESNQRQEDTKEKEYTLSDETKPQPISSKKDCCID